MKHALPAGSDPFAYAAQTNIIGDYITSDSEILGLRILDRNGKGAEAVPPKLDSGVVQELDLALVAAGQGQPYTGTFQYLVTLNQPVVVGAVPISDENQISGSVEGIVSLRRITERIREEGKGEVTAFLVDRNGKVLIHSEPSVDVGRPEMGTVKIVAAFMKARQRLTEGYPGRRDGRPTKMLGTVAPVIRPDWGVVVEKPERSAFASVAKMIKATISWSSLALALAIARAIAFAAWIARPIRALADRTQAIAP